MSRYLNPRLEQAVYFLLSSLLFFHSSLIFAKNELELVIPPAEISKRLTEIALKIDEDYRGEDLTLIMVLKGSLLVTADLMRLLKTPLTIEYIKASTHDAHGKRSGKIELEGFEKLDLKGKNVLLLDDACGTGATLLAIVEKLKEKEPKSIKSLAVILFVKDGKPVCPIQPNYTLFKLEDRYIVGYGIDHKQRYRNLPGIYELKDYD